MSTWSEDVGAAITHMNAMELEPALALLDPLCRDGLTPQSGNDIVALAMALYLQGLVLDRQEHHRPAFDAHRRCIDRYALSPQPAANDCSERCIGGHVIANALQLNPALLVSLPQAHHAIRLPTNVQMFQAIEIEMAEATPEAREDARKSLLTIVSHDDARAGEQHRAALAVMSAHFDHGTPFGLYLRNFDIEATEKVMAGGTLLTMTTSELGHVEAWAERDLAARLPFVGLANGTNFRKDFEHAIPKLEVADGWWQIVLRILVQRAKTIQFDYRHPSAGVATELTLLAELNRATDTVVIVADEAAREKFRRGCPAFERVHVPGEPWAVA